MSPYFCWSLLSLSLKTAGINSDSLSNSAMMAFPLDTILRMAWPHRLFSARKSTMMRKKTADLLSDQRFIQSPHWWPDLIFNKKTLLWHTTRVIDCYHYKCIYSHYSDLKLFVFIIYFNKNLLLNIDQTALKGSECTRYGSLWMKRCTIIAKTTYKIGLYDSILFVEFRF